MARGLRYTACADFEAPGDLLGSELLQQNVCQEGGGLLMLLFDTTSNNGCNDCQLRRPGSRPSFPFDPMTDTYLEVRLDQDLPRVQLDENTDLGPLTGVVGGLDDLLRTNGVDLRGIAIAEGTWSALVGVDPDGFYIGGESTVTLHVSAIGTGRFEPAVDDPDVTVYIAVIA